LLKYRPVFYVTNENVQVAAERAAGVSPHPATEEGGGRVVYLNALPLNALPRRQVTLDVLPVSINELAVWTQRRVAEGMRLVHYIRHVSTINTLRSAGIPLPEQPNSGLYSYNRGDVLVVVTLRSPTRGQEAIVSIEDLDAWIVTVL
jgi:hypothetical protein